MRENDDDDFEQRLEQRLRAHADRAVNAVDGQELVQRLTEQSDRPSRGRRWTAAIAALTVILATALTLSTLQLLPGGTSPAPWPSTPPSRSPTPPAASLRPSPTPSVGVTIPTQPPAEATSTWVKAILPSAPQRGQPVGGPGGGVSALPGGGFIDFVVNGPQRTYVFTSPDGMTWTQRGTVTGFDASGITGPVASNGSVYVALGDEGGGTNYGPQRNGAAWVSSDLVHWNRAPVQEAFGGAEFRDLAGDDSGFVAIGFDQGGQAVWRSTDGLHWSVLDDPQAFPPGSDVEPTAILSTSAGWVMVGRIGDQAAAWTSRDGSRWTRHEPLPGGTGILLDGLANGRAGLVSLALTGGGVEVAPGDWRSPVVPWISVDGVRWTAGPSSPALFGAYASIVAAPGGYVAAGTLGAEPGTHLWTSTDGRQWVPVAGMDGLAASSDPELISDGHHVLLYLRDTGRLLVSAGVQG